jgi:cyclophilin family peptidyl-prolyl cis-trans isomerase
MFIYHTLRKSFGNVSKRVKVWLFIVVVTGVVVGAWGFTFAQKYMPAITAWWNLRYPPEVTYAGAALLTSEGTIEITFYDDAPWNVGSFIRLAEAGDYNGTLFHRIVPDLLIQGGDPLTRYPEANEEWGKGWPGYVVADEALGRHPMVRGTVAMVNMGPDTNGSQFFIVTGEKPSWLDRKHTVIGRVTAGLDAVERIAAIPTDVRGVPERYVTLERVELVSSIVPVSTGTSEGFRSQSDAMSPYSKSAEVEAP